MKEQNSFKIIINSNTEAFAQFETNESYIEFYPNTTHLQVYKGPHALLADKKHNGCSRTFFNFLLVDFYKNNEFTVGRRFFTVFNDWSTSNNGDEYKENTIWKAIQLLADDELIIKLGKSCYRLNPTYYWKGTQKERIQEIKNLIQTGSLKQLNQIIQVPKSKKITH